MKEYQERVDSWIKTIGNGYFGELSELAALTEEVGEIARVINRTYGKQKPKSEDFDKQLGDELAGALFTIACLANSTGIDLQKAVDDNFDKISKRDVNRYKI